MCFKFYIFFSRLCLKLRLITAVKLLPKWVANKHNSWGYALVMDCSSNKWWKKSFAVFSEENAWLMTLFRILFNSKDFISWLNHFFPLPSNLSWRKKVIHFSKTNWVFQSNKANVCIRETYKLAIILTNGQFFPFISFVFLL